MRSMCRRLRDGGLVLLLCPDHEAGVTFAERLRTQVPEAVIWDRWGLIVEDVVDLPLARPVIALALNRNGALAAAHVAHVACVRRPDAIVEVDSEAAAGRVDSMLSATYRL